jgi:hypothetical protein
VPFAENVDGSVGWIDGRNCGLKKSSINLWQAEVTRAFSAVENAAFGLVGLRIAHV